MSEHFDIEPLVKRAALAQRDAVEAMCERMLVTPGPYGVLVTQGPMVGQVTVELSLDVEPMAITYRDVQTGWLIE